MMHTTSTAAFTAIHIHWLFLSIAFFGFIAALLWLNKHANKKDFLNIVWATLILGIVGGLITTSFALQGWQQTVNPGYEFNRGEMMEEFMDGEEGDFFNEMREHMEEEMEEHMEELTE